MKTTEKMDPKDAKIWALVMTEIAVITWSVIGHRTFKEFLWYSVLSLIGMLIATNIMDWIFRKEIRRNKKTEDDPEGILDEDDK